MFDDKDKNKEIDEQIAELSAELFKNEISSYSSANDYNNPSTNNIADQIAELECQKEE